MIRTNTHRPQRQRLGTAAGQSWAAKAARRERRGSFSLSSDARTAPRNNSFSIPPVIKSLSPAQQSWHSAFSPSLCRACRWPAVAVSWGPPAGEGPPFLHPLNAFEGGLFIHFLQNHRPELDAAPLQMQQIWFLSPPAPASLAAQVRNVPEQPQQVPTRVVFSLGVICSHRGIHDRTCPSGRSSPSAACPTGSTHRDGDGFPSRCTKSPASQAANSSCSPGASARFPNSS